MIIFIIPKNSGLERCRNIAQSYSSSAELIEVRGEDVPDYVQRTSDSEKKVIGITGEDLFEEYKLRQTNNNLEVLEKIEWFDENFFYNKPTLCLLGPENKTLDQISGRVNICINSKYRKLSNKTLLSLRNKGYDCQSFYVNGSTEEYFKSGLANLVIDIVCTGKSMKKYGLKVYETILSSDIVILKPKNKTRFSLNDLYETIKQRVENPDPASYTSTLVRDCNLLKRKLIEEAGEVITAESRENLIWECSDLIYFLFAIMAKEGITIEDIEKENERRDKETLINKQRLDNNKKGG